MWIKSSIVLLLVATAAAGIFPPPKLEQYSPGELQLGSVCDLFHWHSEHPLIQTGFYFNKILHRLNRQVPCPKHLTFNKDRHVKVETIRV